MGEQRAPRQTGHRNDEIENAQLKAINIPTDKYGLVEWLNQNVTRGEACETSAQGTAHRER